jgi:hypothetical protein
MKSLEYLKIALILLVIAAKLATLVKSVSIYLGLQFG